MYILQPCARRAHRNPPTYIHPPSVGIIYPIPTYIYLEHVRCRKTWMSKRPGCPGTWMSKRPGCPGTWMSWDLEVRKTWMSKRPGCPGTWMSWDLSVRGPGCPGPECPKAECPGAECLWVLPSGWTKYSFLQSLITYFTFNFVLDSILPLGYHFWPLPCPTQFWRVFYPVQPHSAAIYPVLRHSTPFYLGIQRTMI